MKASELRIGNLVNWQRDTSVFQDKVTAITEKRIVIGKVALKHTCLQPILLTEEWLQKFGFDLINNEYHQSRDHELKLYWTVNKNKMIPEFNEKRFVTGYDFKYVHQLQNLYFILTGEELTIKNK